MSLNFHNGSASLLSAGFQYTLNGRIKELSYSTISGSLQGWRYSYNNLGLIESISDGTATRTFSYTPTG